MMDSKEIYDYLLRIQSISKIGLTYSKDPYALTNYKEINDLTTRFLEEFMEVKFDKHIAEDEKQDALTARKCILRFAREILQGQAHTKEDFIQVLDDIDCYESYCETNPSFPNKRAVFASKLIQDNYQERLAKADFLAEEYRCQLVEKSSKKN